MNMFKAMVSEYACRDSFVIPRKLPIMPGALLPTVIMVRPAMYSFMLSSRAKFVIAGTKLKFGVGLWIGLELFLSVGYSQLSRRKVYEPKKENTQQQEKGDTHNSKEIVKVAIAVKERGVVHDEHFGPTRFAVPRKSTAISLI